MGYVFLLFLQMRQVHFMRIPTSTSQPAARGFVRGGGRDVHRHDEQEWWGSPSPCQTYNICLFRLVLQGKDTLTHLSFFHQCLGANRHLSPSRPRSNTVFHRTARAANATSCPALAVQKVLIPHEDYPLSSVSAEHESSFLAS